MKLIKLNNRGDTIVEVLLAIAVVSSVIGASFVSANRSLKGTQASQERSEALKIAEGQVEYLQELNDTSSGNIFDPDNTLFCIFEGDRYNFSGNNLPALDDDDFSSYPTECLGFEGSRYNMSISYDPDSQDTFTVRARWEGITGDNQEVRLIYRAHELINLTGGGGTPTACPTAVGATTTTSFDISSIALGAAGGNTLLAVPMLDVLHTYTTPASRYTNPDLDLAGLTGNTPFRVAEDCIYRVNYTVFCGANLGSWGTPLPSRSNCENYATFPQLNETFRANFYAAYEGGNPNQCDRSTRLAYFDVPDHFTGPTDTYSSYSGASAVTTVGTGDIRCMEMVSGCEVVGYVVDTLCPVPGSPSTPQGYINSSVYWHDVQWIEEGV